MGGIEDIGRRIGAINTVGGVGAVCGPPIAGLFASTALGYTAVGYFAGVHAVFPLAYLLTGNFRECDICWGSFHGCLPDPCGARPMAEILTLVRLFRQTWSTPSALNPLIIRITNSFDSYAILPEVSVLLRR